MVVNRGDNLQVMVRIALVPIKPLGVKVSLPILIKSVYKIHMDNFL